MKPARLECAHCAGRMEQVGEDTYRCVKCRFTQTAADLVEWWCGGAS